MNDNNTFINEKIIPNFNFKNIFHNNQINNEENYFNTQKSMEFCDQKALNNNEKLSIDSLSKSNSSNINSISKNNNCINGNNGDNHSRKKSKNYYNKFNTAKENNMNENTVILTLKIKVAKNDYRIFNLKKYDDLFISLEKFVDINKIRQELVKPLVTKIFKTLNKIFWLLNNKIGIYDQEYLNSLYKLWIKNNKEIPRTKNKTKLIVIRALPVHQILQVKIVVKKSKVIHSRILMEIAAMKRKDYILQILFKKFILFYSYLLNNI